MTTRNSIDDLREHLFATLRGLQDKDNPMDVDRARAVAHVAGVVIDSARVEVEYARATGSDVASKFLESGREQQPGSDLPAGITGIRQHRIKG